MQNWPKRTLRSLNNYFQKPKQEPLEITIQDLKLQKNYGIVKNFMRLINKALINFNKVEIIKRQWKVGLLGMAMGYGFGLFDDVSHQVRMKYKVFGREKVIQGVLKNQIIGRQLKEVLNSNVFTNADIQYNLHELLMHKAIIPQHKNLHDLIVSSLTAYLDQPQTQKQINEKTASQLQNQLGPISKAALDFLGSEAMDRIVANGLRSLLRGEMFSELLAEQFRWNVANKMNEESSREMVYTLISQQFMFV